MEKQRDRPVSSDATDEAEVPLNIVEAGTVKDVQVD